MFTKLLKHDSRAILKYWWIAALSSVVIAVLCGFCIQIVNVEFTRYESIQVLAVLGIVFSVIGLVIFPVLTEILILVRFYKHFFTDEGYLTFTLPVKKISLLDSKLITAMIFIFVTTLILFADIFILFAIGIPEEVFAPGVWDYVGEFVNEYFGYYGYGAAYIILGILIVLAGSAMQMMFIFVCITVAAAITKRHKVLTAIGIYYGATMAVSMIVQLLSLGGVYVIGDLIASLSLGLGILCELFVMIGILGILVAAGGGLYMFELYLLDRKLNLE